MRNINTDGDLFEGNGYIFIPGLSIYAAVRIIKGPFYYIIVLIIFILHPVNYAAVRKIIGVFCIIIVCIIFILVPIIYAAFKIIILFVSKWEQEYKMIGLNIAYYRKLRGLSQLKLAEETGLSRTHISNIEAPNMPTSISIDTLLDIAAVLNIPAKKLLEFHEV